MVNLSERILILSVILLVAVISQAVYYTEKFSLSEKAAIELGRTFLENEGYYVGKLLSIKQEKVLPNFRYNYALKFERPDLVSYRMCWLIRFERANEPGHYVEVWIDVLEHLVVGGTQCR